MADVIHQDPRAAMWRRAAVDALLGNKDGTFETAVAKLSEVLAPYSLAEVVSYLLQPLPQSDERSGMKCPDCAATQKKIDIHRDTDGAVMVRIAYHIPADQAAREVKGLAAILKSIGRT